MGGRSTIVAMLYAVGAIGREYSLLIYPLKYMNLLVLLWRVMHSFRHAYWLKRLPGVMLIKRKIFG